MTMGGKTKPMLAKLFEFFFILTRIKKNLKKCELTKSKKLTKQITANKILKINVISNYNPM